MCVEACLSWKPNMLESIAKLSADLQPCPMPNPPRHGRGTLPERGPRVLATHVATWNSSSVPSTTKRHLHRTRTS